MQEIFNIWQYAENIAATYNISFSIFLLIYLFSFIPFYLGYFFIIHGSVSGFLKSKDKKIKWNSEVKIGIFINLVGFVMPYIYILLWGHGLPLFVYILIILILAGMLFCFFKKIHRNFIKGRKINNRTIVKKDIIEDEEEAKILWDIYDQSFLETNKKTPCRQSFDKDHFFQILKNATALKYLLFIDNQVVGMGMVTNNLENTPWISEDYFKAHFSEATSSGLLYYFMGIVIFKKYQRMGNAIAIIEEIVKNLPEGAILGFDHSFGANRHLPYFTKIISQAKFIKTKYIDRQQYYVVYRK
jgi:hypothetical protein